jgi:hypothetical protein
MQMKEERQPVDYAKAVATLVAEMSTECAAQVYVSVNEVLHRVSRTASCYPLVAHRGYA